jgi:hypothetical protein
MKKINVFLLTVLAILLIIVFMPLFNGLYEVFFGSNSGDLWALMIPKYTMGFFISYAFFVSFFVSLFGGKNKYTIASIFLGILGIFDFWIGSLELLIIHILIIFLGWTLAQGVILIKKRDKK